MTEGEREIFYRQIVYVGELLASHGVPVIFDATANRRIYREQARRRIPRFFEVFMDAPLEICISRDPKGIYRQAREGKAQTVPGLQSSFEPPENPEITVPGDQETPEAGARRVMARLAEKGWIPKPPEG